MQPLWYPDLYEVEVNLPRNLIAEMDDLNKKGGYIQFSFRDLHYRGFPIDIRQVHWTNPQQTIKLLAHPLSPFTYGYNLITEDWNLITGIKNLITYDVDIAPFVPAVIKSLTANPLVVEISAFTGGTEYVLVEATGGSWEIFHVSSQYVTATKESESSLSISIGRAAGNRIFEVDIRHTIDQRLELRITVLQRF